MKKLLIVLVLLLTMCQTVYADDVKSTSITYICNCNNYEWMIPTGDGTEVFEFTLRR